MQALLSINKGESIYRIMRSQWLRDEDGPILWKMLSKKCLDGKIEAVLYSQRASGRKYVYHNVVCSKEEFPKYIGTVREMIHKLFPDADLEIEDNIPTPQVSASGEATNLDSSRMTAYPAGRLGSLMMRLNYFKNGLLARFWTRVKQIIYKNE
ncbi:hypothetical protein KKD19_06035 [Patescibacteria group bacterium]|nr:hypothetical protein [Patescibacteria group bacterium]MBU4512763.1 hypothetical protein [Patescibacteria group bacterium]MCG2693102.1 hypothetical protein [Candidatus Parcubacteria bacterium]